MAPSTQLLSSRLNVLNGLLKRCQSSLAKGQVDSSKLEIRTAGPGQLNPKPAVKDLVFGKQFTDHMLRIPWTVEGGWGNPRITPLEPFQMHPGAKVLKGFCFQSSRCITIAIVMLSTCKATSLTGTGSSTRSERDLNASKVRHFSHSTFL